MPDGLKTWCKECMNAANAAWRNNNQEKLKAKGKIGVIVTTIGAINTDPTGIRAIDK